MVQVLPVKSVDEGIEILRKFIPSTLNNGHCYGMLMKRPSGDLEVELRQHRPCWGETRRYKQKSNRPFDYHPGDLPTPMGPGSPIAAGMPLNLHGTLGPVAADALAFMIEEENPYKSLFIDSEIVLSNNGAGGFLFKDTGYDSTVQASMFMNLRNYWTNKYPLLQKLQDIHPGLRWHFLTDQNPFIKQGAYTNSWTSSVHPSWTMKRLIEGRPVGLSNGTWRDEKDYNRPFIHYLFADYVDPANYPGSIDVTENHQEDQNTLNGLWAEKADTDPTTAHTMIREICDTLKVTNIDELVSHRKEIEHEVLNRV